MNDRPSPNDLDSSAEHTNDPSSRPLDTVDAASAKAFDALLAASSRQIGPYKLLQEIGVGGMGTVWLAEQEQPVRRRVAVKLIKPGHASKQVMARFEAERQALAMMDHSHIAKVLDAGTAEGGNPYFVMELVQGEPITKYCDRHRLSPRQRLELFIPVCEAIQHAHQKGIIHRDLKPSNVLVQVKEGKPIAKVIDFGLAKALEHQTKLTDKTIFTEFGQIVGTVQYMSPEQARTDAIDVDTRTDTYSLGAILYELMAGSTPLDDETINSNAILQLLEIIREREPPRPSQRLSSSGEKLSSIGEQRQIQPAKLQQILSGDLDWIIMKSLEKDRTRRYATPNDFGDDIRRYLDGDAVEARPPTSGYRLRKFVRKNRMLVTTLGLFLAVLGAGIIGTTTFAVKADRSRRDAEQARSAAEASAKRSQDVLKIVTDSFQAVGPESGGDANMTAKDVLLQAQRNLQASDLDEEGRLVLHQNLTNCFLQLGEYDLATRTAEEALRLSKAQLGENDPVTLSVINDLASALASAGRRDEALPLFEQAFELHKAKFGDNHPDTLRVMNNLADSYYDAGRLNDALPLLEQTSQMSKAQLGHDHPQTLIVMNNLAQAYEMTSRLRDALPLYEEILDICKVQYGEDHPNTLGLMNNLAAAYESAGRLNEALRLKERTLPLCKAKFGDDHPNTLIIMNGMGVAYQKAGRLSEALPLYEEAFRIGKAKLGNDHPDTLLYMGNVAGAYERTDRLEAALSLRTQLLQLSKAKLGEDHHDTLHFMNDTAYTYLLAGKLAEAVGLYEQTLNRRKATLGEDHHQTLHSMNDLAHAYELAERAIDARKILEEILSKPEKQQEESWGKFDTLSQYGGILLKLGETDQAARLLLDGYEGLERFADSIPATHRIDRVTRAIQRLIRLAEAQEKPSEVAKWQEKLAELEATHAGG